MDKNSKEKSYTIRFEHRARYLYAYGHALKDSFETSVKRLPQTAALSPGSFPMFRKLKHGFFPEIL